MRVLITGCARSGTSLLTLLMKGFVGLKVFDRREHRPSMLYRVRGVFQPIAIKFPQGHHCVDEDFKVARGMSRFQSAYVADYADAWKILVCVRDARDVLTSRHPVIRRDQYYITPPRWINAIRRVLPLRDHPNVLLVKYESLVGQPVEQMRRIGDLLRLDYDDTWPRRFSESIHPDSQVVRALNRVRPIDDRSVERWRRPEHQERISEVYQQWGGEIDSLHVKLGYGVGEQD